MIDKLDLRVPRRVGFTSEFDRLYSRLRAVENSPFRSSKYYDHVADLREFGHDIRLNLFCRMQKSGDHKIEVLDAGQKTIPQILLEVSSIFDVNALTLAIMRIDLAVDVEGVSLSWFREAVRIAHKRWRAGLTGDRFFGEMGDRNIQTLYFGKRPNLIRIYDKMQEYRFSYNILKRNLKGQNVPSFEALFSVPDDGLTRTRVERQIGSRIPLQLATFGKVINNVQNFYPFEAIKFIAGVAEPLIDSSLPFETLCTANYLREKAARDGMQAIGPFFNQMTNGNSAWAWKKYGPFFSALDESQVITAKKLQRLYEESIGRQLLR